ncbi:NB-ARC domain [Musa troglodytarum]|uniref:NB-ARC domain n=1 Tax=Musa troglodytarum TaxID=320322 RepID=A0A9E7JRP2_9LILI|nr:NB-ARC domain [Musa troglodytarum]
MAVVLDAFISGVVGVLKDLANEEVDLLLGVPGEIQKLQDTLCNIQSVLHDAEQRRIEDKAIEYWLTELKNAMYDADDILDECRTAAEKCTPGESAPKPSTLCRFPICACFCEVKFRHEVGVKIRDLNDRLEKISARRSKLQLHASATERRVVPRVSRITSPVMESDMVGQQLEEDAKGLVEQLTKQDPSKNVVVLAIVGLGGIGKTTLAQKLFNDGKIKANFGTTIWVCVSQEFSETDLLRNIVSGAGGSHGGEQTRSLLEPLVAGLLRGNKFLLVLDDVWDAQIWDDLLRNPLQGGAAGSWVLVTTRNAGIARQMKAAHVHQMKLLPPEDGWSLLCKKATLNAEEERDAQDLKDTGMKIVEKCGGLPLAIKTIGGVLCTRGLDRSAWEEVLRSAAWSRTGLPEDHVFRGPAVIGLWIAEGFVEARGDVTLEETGEQYLRELLHRSLLQSQSFSLDYDNYCKMHDLLRSLGHFLSGDESLFISDGQNEWRSAAATMKLRRLSIVTNETMDIRDIVSSIEQHESVRTLLVERTNGHGEDIDEYLKYFVRLRVLRLWDRYIEILPYYIGNLIHLRYLNVSYSRVTVLPESVCNLTNLQILILKGCDNLTHVPQGIVRLVNLRTLDCEETRLESLPYGIGRLKHLNELRGFVVNMANGTCPLEALCGLQELRYLSIDKLEKAWMEDEPRSDISGFKGNQKLKHLCLHCSPRSTSDGYTEDQIERFVKVLDVALHPPSSVVTLRLQNFFLLEYHPSWMASANIGSLLPNIRRLQLIYCDDWRQLPPLGKLPWLEFLEIRGARAVTTIGPEFFGCEAAATGHDRERNSRRPSSSSSPPPMLFARLRQLQLKDLSNVQVWDWVAEVFAMGRLSELVLQNCPKLKSLPEGLILHATCLTTLDLTDVCALNSIRGFPSLKQLTISGKSDLEIVTDLPALELLKLGTFSRRNNHLPEWLAACPACFTTLQRLDVYGTTELLVKCLQNGAYWPMIKHFVTFSIKDARHNYINYIKHSSTFDTNLVDVDATAVDL